MSTLFVILILFYRYYPWNFLSHRCFLKIALRLKISQHKLFGTSYHKLIQFLQNLHRLFIMKRWVQNRSNFCNVSIPSKDMQDFHVILFFNSAQLFKNIFLQKLHYLKYFLCKIQIRWNFWDISYPLNDMFKSVPLFLTVQWIS